MATICWIHGEFQVVGCPTCSGGTTPESVMLTFDPVTALMIEIELELRTALARHTSMNSPHEGWAVIREELDELWEHVRANTANGPEARKEAIQIAAMALRYVLDLVPRPATARDLSDLGIRVDREDARPGPSTVRPKPQPDGGRIHG